MCIGDGGNDDHDLLVIKEVDDDEDGDSDDNEHGISCEERGDRSSFNRSTRRRYRTIEQDDLNCIPKRRVSNGR